MLQTTQPPRPFRSRLQRLGKELFEVVLAAAALYALMSALTDRFVIQQLSMEPNLHAGQLVIVSRWESLVAPWVAVPAHAGGLRENEPVGLRRGQIIVFNARTPLPGVDRLVKRVVALPGDTVLVAGGQVFVNGEALDEPYVAEGEATDCASVCGPLTLGGSQYFMLGDNRTVSYDSRNFGPIDGSQIIGRVVVRYWPLENFTLYP